MHHIAGRGLPLPQVYALVVTEFPVGHVAVVADDLPDVLGGHVLFLRVHEAEFSLLRIALGLQLLPLAGCGDREAAGSGPVPLGRMRVQGPALPTFLLQLLLRHVVGQRRQRAGHRGAAAAVREDGGHGDAPAGVERSSGQGRGHPRPLPRHPHRHPPPTPGPHRPPPALTGCRNAPHFPTTMAAQRRRHRASKSRMWAGRAARKTAQSAFG